MKGRVGNYSSVWQTEKKKKVGDWDWGLNSWEKKVALADGHRLDCFLLLQLTVLFSPSVSHSAKLRIQYWWFRLGESMLSLHGR